MLPRKAAFGLNLDQDPTHPVHPSSMTCRAPAPAVSPFPLTPLTGEGRGEGDVALAMRRLRLPVFLNLR
jgi:hypothetical protein